MTVYSTGQAAKLLGLSQNTVIRCFDQKLIDGFKVPNSRFRRIPRASLLKFARANNIPLDRIQPTAEELGGEVIGPVRVNRVAGLVEAS